MTEHLKAIPDAETTARGSITRDGDYAVIRVPMADVHSLRVALHPCACKGAKSNSTQDIRNRLDKGLARLEAGRA